MLDTIRLARVMRRFCEIYHERSRSTDSLISATKFVDCCLSLAAPLVAPAVALSPAEESARTAHKVEQLQNQFHQLLVACRLEEQSILGNESRPQDLLGEEFDRLMELASVVNVAVVPGLLKVETSVLYCRDPRTNFLHEIGAFEIHIPTEEGEVLWFNRHRTIHAHSVDMHAPHVFKDGRACLGNVKDLFPRLIARRDFSTAVQVAIAFIESVNVADSAGKFINLWPVVQQ